MGEIVQITSAPSRAMYEGASAELMDVLPAGSLPAGLIVHTAAENADGTVQIIDVWESREAAEEFGRDVLGPIIARQAAAAGMDLDASGPPVEITEPFAVLR